MSTNPNPYGAPHGAPSAGLASPVQAFGFRTTRGVARIVLFVIGALGLLSTLGSIGRSGPLSTVVGLAIAGFAIVGGLELGKESSSNAGWLAVTLYVLAAVSAVFLGLALLGLLAASALSGVSGVGVADAVLLLVALVLGVLNILGLVLGGKALADLEREDGRGGAAVMPPPPPTA